MKPTIEPSTRLRSSVVALQWLPSAFLGAYFGVLVGGAWNLLIRQTLGLNWDTCIGGIFGVVAGLIHRGRVLRASSSDSQTRNRSKLHVPFTTPNVVRFQDWILNNDNTDFLRAVGVFAGAFGGKQIMVPHGQLLGWFENNADAFYGFVAGGLGIGWLTNRIINLLAARGRNTQVFDPSVSQSSDSTLMTMVRLGDKQGIQEHLDAGQSIEQRSEDGSTPLMIAASCGHIEVVKLLIAAGSSVRAATNHGWTAVMLSAAFGHPEVAEYLLESGADVEGRNDAHMSALGMAVAQGHSSVVTVLLEYGASVGTVGDPDLSVTPLIIAAGEGHLEVVKLLLAKGADVNIKSSDGYTAIDVAARQGRKEIVSVLREAGAPEISGWWRFAYSAPGAEGNEARK